MKTKTLKKKKIQHHGSNRHGAPITESDIKNIRNAYNSNRAVFDSMAEEDLQQIVNNGYMHDGKKLTGTYKGALDHSLKLKQLTKLKQNEEAGAVAN